MSTRTAPPLVTPEDLVTAGNRIASLSRSAGGISTQSVLGIAGVHLLGAANVTAQIVPPIAEGMEDGSSDEDILGLGFGLGIALGAIAAQEAAARASGQVKNILKEGR